MLGKIFERFVKQSPISVMARGLLERVLGSDQLDELFARVSQRQYIRELLFSSVFDLLSQVVCSLRPSVHAAYQADPESIGVSITSVYNKLNGIETQTAASMVRHSAEAMTPIIHEMRSALSALLPGYRIKILDGHCLASTEHRIAELRQTAAGALPGKSLAVFDPALKLFIDVFPCADGHAQERTLLHAVVKTVEPGDCWIADRNFCTRQFLFDIKHKNACFIVRQHQSMPWRSLGRMKKVGRTDSGEIYEEPICITDDDGNELRLRRVRIRLDQPTRDGEEDVFVLTNLPKKVSALKVADLYGKRWRIETAFQELAEHLNGEINTLGYPQAALFGFCVALVAYNVMSVIQAALRSVHGEEKIAQEVSGYYVADEIAATYRGMMIAIPDKHWRVFKHMTACEFGGVMRMLAEQVNLSRFKKHPRGPKKPRPQRKFDKRHPHVATARLLEHR